MNHSGPYTNIYKIYDLSLPSFKVLSCVSIQICRLTCIEILIIYIGGSHDRHDHFIFIMKMPKPRNAIIILNDNIHSTILAHNLHHNAKQHRRKYDDIIEWCMIHERLEAFLQINYELLPLDLFNWIIWLIKAEWHIHASTKKTIIGSVFSQKMAH